MYQTPEPMDSMFNHMATPGIDNSLDYRDELKLDEFMEDIR
jgi:hypothetical protein